MTVQILALAVLDVALVDEGLEVGAVLDAVGRVDVDHLHLARHALLLQQGVHHQERIAGDQAVAPAVLVPVELDRLAQPLCALHLEQGQLHLPTIHYPLSTIHFSHRLDDGLGVNALVDVQGDGGRLKGGVLGLARPDQLRVEVWVVGVGLPRPRVRIRVGRHQASGRVVDALFVAVLVGFDGAFGLGLLLSCHQILPVGFVMR